MSVHSEQFNTIRLDFLLLNKYNKRYSMFESYFIFLNMNLQHQHLFFEYEASASTKYFSMIVYVTNV
jgi:hypothetical protein